MKYRNILASEMKAPTQKSVQPLPQFLDGFVYKADSEQYNNRC